MSHVRRYVIARISFQKDRGRWRVRLKVDTSRYQIGYYKNRADALAAYNRARVVLAELQAARATTTEKEQLS